MAADLLRPDERALLAAFEDATLPGASFNHAMHVRLAWISLRAFPREEAFARFTAALTRYAASLGKPGKFHAEMTKAYLARIDAQLALVGRDTTFEVFSEASPDLFDRRRFVFPDAV
jgi:hypothetical protein